MIISSSANPRNVKIRTGFRTRRRLHASSAVMTAWGFVNRFAGLGSRHRSTIALSSASIPGTLR